VASLNLRDDCWLPKTLRKFHVDGSGNRTRRRATCITMGLAWAESRIESMDS
jgi:hypothetical protein